MESFTPPGDCPVCGSYVERGALSCDECGSCEETGWNEDSYLDGVDLPDVDSELDSGASGGRSYLWAIVAAVLIALFVASAVFGDQSQDTAVDFPPCEKCQS